MTYVCALCAEAFSIKRFKDHIEETHKVDFEKYLRDIHYGVKVGYCLNCGIETKRQSFKSGKYSKYCCNHCQLTHQYSIMTPEDREKRSTAIKEAWDKESRLRQSQIRKMQLVNKTEEDYFREHEKAKQTKLKRYGDENYGNYGSDKFKQTMLSKYGVDNAFKLQQFSKNGTIEKTETIRKNCRERFGRDWVRRPDYVDNNIEKRKETCLERYGVEHYMQSEQEKAYSKTRTKKARATKRRNGTTNTSKPEDKIFKILLSRYKTERQYSSEKYPFSCDFYLADYDIYIEYNGYFTHGEHSFDSNCENDINKLNEWLEKSKTSNFIKNAIYVWTNLDKKKAEIAKTNNLKYLVYYGKPPTQETLFSDIERLINT